MEKSNREIERLYSMLGIEDIQTDPRTTLNRGNMSRKLNSKCLSMKTRTTTVWRSQIKDINKV